MFTFASDKAELFAENFFRNTNLGSSGISLPTVPCESNLKLDNICLDENLVKRFIIYLDSSEVSDHGCIPVVHLKDCELELSYILA